MYFSLHSYSLKTNAPDMKQGLFPIFLIVFLLSSTVTFAQKGNIHGFVKEAETGDAMIGASVFIEGTSTGTVTDFNGEFTLSGISEGSATLEFTYLGFSPLQQVVEVVGGSTQELTIAMEYESVSLIEGEVIVTAQASAQMAAINKQRSSNTIANVISVKRIQELPDANAAEVVGRLPGVSLQREGGEGSKVVIRGLAPKYNSVTIEGVSMASTGGDNRSSDMSMISPYMLEGIEIFKAAMPDKEANAHGGSINFVLKQAPKKFRLDAFASVGNSYLYTEKLSFASLGKIAPYNEKIDYKLSIGASNRFFHNKLGVFAQINHERRNRTAHNLYVSYVPHQPIYVDTDADISNISLTKTDHGIKRFGATLVLDYKIKNGSIKLTNFLSTINKDILKLQDIFGMTYQQHFHGYNRIQSNLLIHTSTLSLEKTMGSFKFKLNSSSSKANNIAPSNITLLGLEDSAFKPGVQKQTRIDSILSYAKNDYTATRFEKISSQYSDAKEIQYSSGASLEFTHRAFSHSSFTYKIGGKLKVLSKTRDIDNKNIPVSWGLHGAPYRAAITEYYDDIQPSVNISYVNLKDNTFDGSNFLNNQYELSTPFDGDRAETLAQIAEDNNLYLIHYPSDNMSDYSGTEAYWAGYAMLTYKYKKLLTFIPGFRYEKNLTEYTGVRGDELALNEYQGYRFTNHTTQRKNHFFLPMFHLKVTPTKWLDIRMSSTQTLSRPDFTQIVPSWNIALSTITWNNPYLEPSKSKNFDFFVSAYHSKVGFLSAGFFQKKIENLIFNAGLSSVKDPSEYGLPISQKGKQITKIVNNKFPLTIKGLETEYKTKFLYANNFLKGVVLNLNYTHIFSEVKYPVAFIRREFISEPPFIISNTVDTFYTDRFLQQPNDIFNATLGYDLKGFSFRVSYLYRTKIFKQSDYWINLRADSDDYSRWDFSFKQKLPKNIEILLNVANPFGKPERVRLKNSSILSEQNYGTTIDLGLRYRFQ